MGLGGGHFPGSGCAVEGKDQDPAWNPCLPGSRLLVVLTQGPATAAWSGPRVALDAVGASPRLTLTSMSNGQEPCMDVILDSHIHFGEQSGLPGALRLPRPAGVGAELYSEAKNLVSDSLPAVMHRHWTLT